MLLKVLWAIPIFVVDYLFYFVVGVVPSYVLRIFGRKISDKYLFFSGRWFSKSVLFLLGVKVDVGGNVENLKITNKSVCYIANHTSLLDILMILGTLKLKTGFVAKKILAFVPLFNLTEFGIHCVFIKRNSLKDGVKSVRKGAENIRKGFSMLIFPEGTRSKTGEIAPFKHGSFRMATESGAVIVPISICGLRQSLEDRQRCFQKRLCKVYIGDVIETQNSTDKIKLSEMPRSDIPSRMQNSTDRVVLNEMPRSDSPNRNMKNSIDRAALNGIAEKTEAIIRNLYANCRDCL